MAWTTDGGGHSTAGGNPANLGVGGNAANVSAGGNPANDAQSTLAHLLAVRIDPRIDRQP